MFGKKKTAPKKSVPAKKTPRSGQLNGAPRAVHGNVGRSVPTGAPANRPKSAPQANVSGKSAPQNGSPNRTANNPAQSRPVPNNAQKSASRKGLFKKNGKKPANNPVQSRPAPQNGSPNRPANNPAQSRTAPNNAQKSASRKGLFKKNGRKPANNPAQGRPAPNGAQKPVAKPLKPVPEQARKAADRATLAKTRTEQPKRPYRGGNYTLYFILAAVVVGIVLAVLSNTVLFKCGTIEVSGATRYSADEIIAVSGVKTGDNLLHIDEKKAAESVMNTFAFVDNVQVKKYYPTKIVIEITEAVNWFALVQDGKTNVISRGERVLGELPADGLVVLKGFEAQSLEVGARLSSAVEAKNKVAEEIFNAAEKVGLEKMTEIDITDRFSIKITVDGRIVLNIGSSNQLESKLRVAQALIEKEIGEDERVSVLLTNPEKVAVESIQPERKPTSSSSDKQASDNSSGNSSDLAENSSSQPQE